MKKIIIILFACLPLIILGQEKKKIEVKPYGFIQGNMIYTTAGVYSWGNPANNYLSAPQLASGVEDPAMGFTAQHTRFGLKINKDGDVKVGGKLELDFYGGPFDANGKPRIRQAFAYLATGNFEVRFGQQWDLFSPVNASTNNTNGNMWYAGNRGFRRAQIQLIYKLPGENFTPMLQVSAGEGAKEAKGLGIDNMAASPMFQGRLSAKIKEKYTVGVYFVQANFKEAATDSLGKVYNVDYEFSTSGFGADINLNFHKYFSLKGEVNMGTNLNNANLFNIAGNCGYSTDATGKVTYTDKKSLGLWFNAISKITDHFHVVVGFGMDQNQTDDLAKGAVESNTVIYGDLIFPIKNGFSIALEVQNITTAIKEGDNNSATVINLAGKITF